MFVFVGCSYSPWPLAGYKGAFSEAMKTQQSVVFEFADVRISDTWILDKVIQHIERSDLGLFDITFLNPNVLLELGVALGMKKRAHVFMNSQFEEETGFFKRIFSGRRAGLPINLQGLELVRYSSRSDLVAKLASLSSSLTSTIDPRTLNHSSRVRGAVLKIIRDDPGIGIRQIESKSGETIDFVRTAISRLRKEGLVIVKNRTQYFPKAASQRRATPQVGPDASGPPA
jgi:hypothetical protein